MVAEATKTTAMNRRLKEITKKREAYDKKRKSAYFSSNIVSFN